jgi:hypothetical protein
MRRWPWWDRNQTTGIEDVSQFANNMGELQPLFMSAIMAISRCDIEEPDEHLKELEAILTSMGGPR